MTSEDSLTPVFRAYQEENLTSLTLHEVLRDDYLRPVIMWLIGYDGSRPLRDQINDRPLRAQEVGSSWQVAWTILDCLDARAIFIEDEVHPNLVREIDRKLLGDKDLLGATAWLLKQGYYEDKELIDWDRRLFDTGIVLRALMQLQKTYYEQLDTPEMSSTVEKGLRWLAHRVRKEDGLDWDTNGAVGQAIQAFSSAATMAKSEYRIVQGEYTNQDVPSSDLLLDTVRIILNRKLESEMHSPDVGEIQSQEKSKSMGHWRWRDHQGVIRALNQVVETAVVYDADTEIEQIRTALRSGVYQLEQDIAKGTDHHGPRSSSLAAYIVSCACLKREGIDATEWNDSLVAHILHDQCRPDNRFVDGSIYLDLYATQYYSECLAKAIIHWPRANETVLKLNEDAIKGMTTAGKLTTERRQIYRMNRIVYELKRQLLRSENRVKDLTDKNESLKIWNRQRRRMVLLAFIGLAFLSIVLLWLGPGWNIGGITFGPADGQADAFLALFSIAITVTAIIVTAIEIVFFRGRGE
jgi:hypothetical protein